MRHLRIPSPDLPETESGKRLSLPLSETNHNQPTKIMLHWTLVFLVIAIIAGLLGFTGIAGTSAKLAKILFIIFLIIWIISFFTLGG